MDLSNSEWVNAHYEVQNQESDTSNAHPSSARHAHQCVKTSGIQAIENRGVYALYGCYEEGPASFGAYVPDLPGCIAAGESAEEVLQLIQEAIEFHIEALKKKVNKSRYRILQACLLRFEPDAFSKFPDA